MWLTANTVRGRCWRLLRAFRRIIGITFARSVRGRLVDSTFELEAVVGPEELVPVLDSEQQSYLNCNEFEEEVMESGTVMSLMQDLIIESPSDIPDRLLFGEDPDE